MPRIGWVVDQGEVRRGDHLAHAVGKEGTSAHHGLTAERATDDREEGRRSSRIEDGRGLKRRGLDRTQHARRPTNRVAGGLFYVEIAR